MLNGLVYQPSHPIPLAFYQDQLSFENFPYKFLCQIQCSQVLHIPRTKTIIKMYKRNAYTKIFSKPITC